MDWHVRDAQCYLLCGERDSEVARMVVDERMQIVGTVETFGQFYDALRQRAPFAGFPACYQDHLGNCAPRAVSRAEILAGNKPDNWRDYVSVDTFKKIERDNADDLALFEYVLGQRSGLVVNGPAGRRDEEGSHEVRAPDP